MLTSANTRLLVCSVWFMWVLEMFILKSQVSLASQKVFSIRSILAVKSMISGSGPSTVHKAILVLPFVS